MKFKKTILSLGTLASIVVPVTTIIACSDAEAWDLGDGVIKIEGKANKINKITLDINKLIGYGQTDLGKIDENSIIVAGHPPAVGADDEVKAAKAEILKGIADAFGLVVGTKENGSEGKIVFEVKSLETVEEELKAVKCIKPLPFTFSDKTKLYGAKQISTATATTTAWTAKFNGNSGREQFLESITLEIQ